MHLQNGSLLKDIFIVYGIASSSTHTLTQFELIISKLDKIIPLVHTFIPSFPSQLLGLRFFSLFEFLLAVLVVSVETGLMKNAFTVLAVGQVSSNLAELAVILILSELNSFEEILGVVGFSGFGDILFNGEIED